MRHSSLKGWAVVLGASMSVVAMTTPASAHYVYEEVDVFQTDSQCVTNRSEVSHGSYGHGYAKGRTESTQDLPIWGVDCRYEKAKQPGWLADFWVYYFWNGTEWVACGSVPWT